MRLFDEYGSPSTARDIAYIDYLFLRDYVDRGQHNLETICLLLALKVEYPQNVHLICGNHEAADINALFGFRFECIEHCTTKLILLFGKKKEMFLDDIGNTTIRPSSYLASASISNKTKGKRSERDTMKSRKLLAELKEQENS
ncbi:serine/threonine-protein phosphatase [Tanacetum coccineum]|uniref:Serine/threonine-protein phosphatase n=1 Tax=Tanacetum coccineum TaxID=301880 RepID=A0ABQ5CH66_9ASTR